MRVVVVASGERDWLRRLAPQNLSVPALLWVEGPEAIAESHRLSALLSERGYPNRWLSLYKRPALREEALSTPWPQTRLATYLAEVPLLVLSDTEIHLYALWKALGAQSLIHETLFLVRHYKHPLLLQEEIRLPSQQSAEWAMLYEDLLPDLQAAATWQPCKLVPTLS